MPPRPRHCSIESGPSGGRYGGRPRRRRPRRPRRRARARLGSREKCQWEPLPPTGTRPPPGAPRRRHTACPAGRSAAPTGCSRARASTSLTRTQVGMVVPNHTAGQRDAGRVAMDQSSRAPARMSQSPAQRLHHVHARRARGRHQRRENRRRDEQRRRRRAIGSTPGIWTSVDVAADDPREQRARRSTPATMPAHGDHRAFAEHARQQVPRRRADRQPDAELARPRAHRERQHAGDADDRDQSARRRRSRRTRARSADSAPALPRARRRASPPARPADRPTARG